MREIKFRAWDAQQKKMLSLFECYDIFGRELRSTNGKLPLMQFTNIKDANGTEIYEGDILAKGEDEYRVIYQVVFWEGAFGVMSRHYGFRLVCEFAHIEVIGNIYENPKLLERKR